MHDINFVVEGTVFYNFTFNVYLNAVSLPYFTVNTSWPAFPINRLIKSSHTYMVEVLTKASHGELKN